ncbi:hypothetical protein [Zhouia amylolytica]|uniref:Uncharacterized protein n=1 Tax=Zhouia amylolytica AD3 TaxID=1286632 RepID=W2UPA9_9FLAO|nr:hypothetical protein [Zhouia amylolytica]ETN95306.1 hypothetical protein P278_10280 [Zhouia amylolytica AD3]MCQ0112452.1 hypothetical protein [Zhouia amylolytica]
MIPNLLSTSFFAKRIKSKFSCGDIVNIYFSNATIKAHIKRINDEVCVFKKVELDEDGELIHDVKEYIVKLKEVRIELASLY